MEDKYKTVFCITGGCGFMGINLIKKLNDLGYVNIIVVDSKKNKDLLYGTVISEFIDIVDEAIPEFDILYHFGADTDENSEYFFEKNLIYSLQYALVCKINNHKKIPFVFASSSDVYGSVRLESDEPNPLNRMGECKIAFEETLNKILPETSTSLRFHNVYGHNEINKKSLVYDWINGKNHELYEDSNNTLRDYIHINDSIDICIMIFDYFYKHKCLPFNFSDVGTGKSVSIKKIGEEISKYTKREISYSKNINKENYQYYTEADIKILKKVYFDLYKKEFKPMDYISGIEKTKNDYLYHQSLKLSHLW